MIDKHSLRWTGLTSPELECVLEYAVVKWSEQKVLFRLAEVVRDRQNGTNTADENALWERRATIIENLAAKLP